MPNICFVPGCNTGLPNDRKCYEGKKYPSTFHPPENMIGVWNKKIPRADRDLKKNDVVCELHFHSNDVIKYKKYEDDKGNDIIIQKNMACNPTQKHSNKVLRDFIDYLEAWELKSPDKRFRFTSQSERGLTVTIKSTLELIDYLSEKVGYKYLNIFKPQNVTS